MISEINGKGSDTDTGRNHKRGHPDEPRQMERGELLTLIIW